MYKDTFRKKMKASEKTAFDLVAKDEAEKYEHCARDHAQKHGLFAANHCARWRTRRSHNVVLVSELQQFPSGRLRLVGLWGKIHRVVVRDLWRKVRLEATGQS